MSGERFEAWLRESGREHAYTIEASDTEDAARRFCDERGLDLDTTEVDVCVAAVESDEVETFTCTAECIREWYAREWPSPLARFGAVIREAARWELDTPRREAAEAELRTWREEMIAIRERRDALETIAAVGAGIHAALDARDALRDLGLDDEDHASAFAIYAALSKITGSYR